MAADVKTGDEDAFILKLSAYEGPLDLLLEQARAQKVDLAQISILELVDQYFAFVEKAQRLRLELAADYLVMASWLALLKSRLLLPAEDSERATVQQTAENLALQLRRLDAIKTTMDALDRRRQLGRDWFASGSVAVFAKGVRASAEGATLRDLLLAYVEEARRRRPPVQPDLKPFDLCSVDEAIKRLEALLGSLEGWRPMEDLLPKTAAIPLKQRSRRASHFVASLELVRRGDADLRQEAPFAPVYLRRRAEASL